MSIHLLDKNAKFNGGLHKKMLSINVLSHGFSNEVWYICSNLFYGIWILVYALKGYYWNECVHKCLKELDKGFLY